MRGNDLIVLLSYRLQHTPLVQLIVFTTRSSNAFFSNTLAFQPEATALLVFCPMYLMSASPMNRISDNQHTARERYLQINLQHPFLQTFDSQGLICFCLFVF